MTRRQHLCVTIAGVDTSGEAGTLLDAGIMRRVGVRPGCVVTAVTAQNTNEVLEIHPLPLESVEAQIEALARGKAVAAVKTGMLWSPEIVSSVSRGIESLGSIPLVVDPVELSTSGKSLSSLPLREALFSELFPLATLITPNLPECRRLLGSSSDPPEVMARKLSGMTGSSVLLKGGHGEGKVITDLLVLDGEIMTFWAQRRPGSFRGTGCALSSAIAAHLALGVDLPAAIRASKALLTIMMEEAMDFPDAQTHIFHP